MYMIYISHTERAKRTKDRICYSDNESRVITYPVPLTLVHGCCVNRRAQSSCDFLVFPMWLSQSAWKRNTSALLNS